MLDLVNQRAEAVEVAYRGIEDARRAGLEAVYGNFLAGNVVDTLFYLGRWPELRTMSRRAMSWLSVGVVHMEAVLMLAAVAIETDAGEEASRLLGQTVLELAAVREPQLAGPYYLAAASFALWRGDVADASRSVDQGWASVRETEEWVLVARMAAMVAQVDAATADEARQNRQLAPLAAARERTAGALAAATAAVKASGAPSTAGSRRVAEAFLATARGYQRRSEGDDSAVVWRHVADGWAVLEAPYEEALARWRQAEAQLAAASRSGRTQAQAPLLAAVEIGLRLEARPLLRELVELARRARITLPDAVGVLVARDAVGAASEHALAAVGGQPGRGSHERAVGARPCRGRRPTGDHPATGHVRVQRTRTRGAHAGRPGPDQPRDRRAPVHQPEDGRRPRRQHPGEARGLRSGRGGSRRHPTGVDRAELKSPGMPRDPEGGLRVSIGDRGTPRRIRPDGAR